MDKPIIIKNFINQNDINFIMNWLNDNEYKFDQHVSTVDYWNSRCIHYTSVGDPNIQKFLYRVVNSMRDILEIITSPQRTLYVEEPQFVRWPTGIELPPHADNIEPDGVTPNTSPWRSHGGVLYFNEDFEGGEIYYPFLDNFTVKPEPGMMVIHSADLRHTHGVKKVTSGTRHTMSVFFTYDKAHGIMKSGSSELL